MVRPLEESKDLFTAFADVLLEFDSLPAYMAILFAYMPSNVEVIHPETLEIKNSDLAEMGNVILQRLHHYDSLVKGIMNERTALINKLREVAPQLFEQPPQKQESLEDAIEGNSEESKKKSKKSKKE